MRGLAFSTPIFRQLVEFQSYTYTYILGCEKTRQAVIIDPVDKTADRDIQLLKDFDLNLVYGLNTHVHADHITGTHLLRKAFPSMKSVLSRASGGKADRLVDDGEDVQFGEQKLEVRATPGHTNGCVTYVWHELRRAFTGDSLLVRACGRTDFQEGNAAALIFIGHNYNGILQTSVLEEKNLNPRLTKTEEKFLETMENLHLAHPKQLDEAVPANMKDGEVENSS
ncbi:unnamed protein product [Caenorhabditis auriculariae]|uniref:Persulfide dioxygenase ETHE1, mitochondrial n=1 Tax=Caenorhabditis auriculariae TaxID=2777116 RepID=A0A8S1HNV9_9PELO|nr:unnamed protein product [Caenorhabditis auriculariae]